VYLFKRFFNGTLEGICRLAAKSTFNVDLGAMFVVSGTIFNRGLIVLKQGTPAAKTTSATLTAAEVTGGIITANQGGGAAATYTTPTATQIEAAMPTGFALNDSFDLALVNISTAAAETATIGARFRHHARRQPDGRREQRHHDHLHRHLPLPQGFDGRLDGLPHQLGQPPLHLSGLFGGPFFFWRFHAPSCPRCQHGCHPIPSKPKRSPRSRRQSLVFPRKPRNARHEGSERPAHARAEAAERELRSGSTTPWRHASTRPRISLASCRVG
jgi:hypothetical protein